MLVALTLRGSAKDPVCGMTVDRNRTPHRSDRHGETVYFCSAHCKKQFDAEPERYVGRDRPLRPAHAGHEGHHSVVDELGTVEVVRTETEAEMLCWLLRSAGISACTV